MFESFARIRSSKTIDYLNLPLDRGGLSLLINQSFSIHVILIFSFHLWISFDKTSLYIDILFDQIKIYSIPK